MKTLFIIVCATLYLVSAVLKQIKRHANNNPSNINTIDDKVIEEYLEEDEVTAEDEIIEKVNEVKPKTSKKTSKIIGNKTNKAIVESSEYESEENDEHNTVIDWDDTDEVVRAVIANEVLQRKY